MKLLQTNNQIIIKQNGLMQLVLGIIFVVIGGGLVILGVRPSAGSGSPKSLLLVGLIFAVIGLLVLIFAKSQQTTLVRDGLCEVRTKRLLGGKVVDNSFAASTIAKVRLNVYWERTAGGPDTTTQPQRRSNLSLIMNDQSQLELADAGASNVSINGLNLSAFTKAPLYGEAEQLAKFLGIPLEVGDNGQFGFAGISPSATPTFSPTGGNTGSAGSPSTVSGDEPTLPPPTS